MTTYLNQISPILQQADLEIADLQGEVLGLQGQVADLTDQHSADQATIVDLQAQLVAVNANLQAQLAAVKPVTTTLFGSCLAPWTLSQADAAFGKVPVVRLFWPGLPPNAGPGTDTAGRKRILSFKCSKDAVGNLDLAGVAAGKYDSTITAFLKACDPVNDIVDFFHEKDKKIAADKLFTWEQYLPAAQHVFGLASNAGIKTINIYTSVPFYNNTSRPASSYWVPGASFVGVDIDGFTGYPDITSWVANVKAFAASKGVSWCVPEFGTPRLSTDTVGQARATWLTTGAQKVKAAGATMACLWFDAPSVLTPGSPEAMAWKSLVGS